MWKRVDRGREGATIVEHDEDGDEVMVGGEGAGDGVENGLAAPIAADPIVDERHPLWASGRRSGECGRRD